MTAYRGRGRKPRCPVLRPVPAQVDPGVVLVDLFGGPPDELGRSVFAAYWADDNHWRGGEGVTGQVSIVRLPEYAELWALRGHQVLIMTDAGNMPVADYLAAQEVPHA